MGVYVHFPWCRSKCPYCDFLSLAAETIPHRAYADAVIAELEARAASVAGRRVHSVFFGGGTPSLWEPRELGRVLEAIARRCQLGRDAEVTVECNPSSLDEQRARELRLAGVGRLSVGVQSLDERRLQFLGRVHDPAEARTALRAARAAGLERLSADLIFGLPGQPALEPVAHARELLDLGVEHLSAYALTIEPGTVFGARARQGRLPLAPDDAVADSFDALHEALELRGLEHYEVSNYARPGAEARHNLGYWLGADYLGLGTGAWGTVRQGQERVRYRNTPSPERYLAWARREGPTRDSASEPAPLESERETLPPETLLRERILLGLRLSRGLDVDAAAIELSVDPWPRDRARARDRLLASGQLIREGSSLRIPSESWLLADGIIAALL